MPHPPKAKSAAKDSTARLGFGVKLLRSGSMFVPSEKFVESHGGKLGDISVYGQEKWARRLRLFGLAKRAGRVSLRWQQPKQSNATTHRLAIRGIEADFGPEHAYTNGRNLVNPFLNVA
jgi:type I restriction enzyme M protein